MALDVETRRIEVHRTGIRARLSADVGALAPAQRRLASYLLEHFSSASDLGITDLADEAGVSVGTISMLCRRLGLRGYQDLRLGIAREAVSMSRSGGYGADSDDREQQEPLEAAINRVFGAGTEAVAETGRQLDRAALRSAVDLIAAARRVEWVGVGSAGLVAAEGALKLRKLGVASGVQFDGHQQAMSAAVLDERDVVIAVSHSGRTTDVVDSVRVGRDAGARVIAITGVTASPLARLAHVILGTVSYDTGFQVEPMASTLAQLAVVQLLFLAYLEQAGDVAQTLLARTQAALETRHVKGRLS
jgi:RpiR family carbohydrate utilization transcriptional regulator